MGKRPALGRGLAALLGESGEGAGAAEAPRAGAPDGQGAPDGRSAPDGREAAMGYGEAAGVWSASTGVVDLPVTAIRRNPRQPRRAIEAEALDELAQSIAEVGIVQPVIVRPLGEGYELIAGERRWRAAQQAGFTVLPAIIRAASDVESLELALIENVVRQQLNPLDEAFALKVLLDDLGVTQESLAARVGKSRSAIANKVRLLDLPAAIQDALAEGLMSEGHGRALLGVKGQARQLQLARRITGKGLSVRQVEEEVRRLEQKGDKQPLPKAPAFDEETVDALRESFYASLGVMPRIKSRGGGGGVIELPFKDLEDLQRICDRLES